MPKQSKEAAMETATPPIATLPHIATNMGNSILKALPTGSKIQQVTHHERKDDFESFAASKPRVFSPNGHTFQLSD